MRLKGLVLGCLITLLGSSYAQTEVVWWDFLSGGDGVRMKSMIDAFNESHPDIKIVPTTLEWGTPFYTKVQTSTAVGEGPDIMTYHLSRYPLAMESDILRPISDEELASVGLSKEDLPEGLVEAATFEDQLYGIPFDVHAIILYYNKDCLQEAGLLGEDGLPQGLEGIENFNAALEAAKGTGKLPLSIGTAEQGSLWRIFYTLLKQQGGAILQGDEVVMGEEGQRALETITNWVEQGYARKNVEYEASVALFTGGEACFHINGVWEVPTMVDLAANGELGFDWGAIVIPVLFDQPATWADSHTFAIPNSERDPISEEKLAAVLEVMAWMSKNSITWATAGHIPAYEPVVASAEYQAMQPNATYAPLVDNAAFDPRTPVAGVASPTYDAVGNFLLPSVNGQLPADQAVEMFTQDLASQLR
jgi:multiple sugar transport system substrate-binding protein